MTGPLLLLLALLALARPALAELPDEPILRLEPGMHGAPIRRIDVDAGERFLVTGADDKTVRVWSLDDGRPLKTLRVPIGEGDVGKINAVAISPDGERIAAGGWGPNDLDNSIYVLERASGRIVDRIDGLPNVIAHLVFSPDGRYLVACLGDANGIRVYETEGFGEVAADPDYGADSYWAAFDRQRRLVTSSYDGKIRLYDPDFRLIETHEAPGGERPFAVAFSPDGARIAVGYGDSTKVDVLDGRTLAPVFAADTAGIDNGSLGGVAWSADGKHLYASGTYGTAGYYPVRIWSDGDRGGYEEIALGRDTTMALRPLADGRLAFGAADPTLGVLSADGQVLWRQDPAQADFRDQSGTFAVSPGGVSVAFGFEQYARSPAVFDLTARRLTPDPEPDPALAAARAEAPGLEIEDWYDEDTPTLNGERLPLKQYEMSRSLAIAPDGERFLLGTEWYLRLFDRQGEQLWQKPVPGVAWAVNITGDGRLAIAAFGDGTIRWFRLEDGLELLAFFPHADRERWVAWTPQGYYMASPGGEELIGWHVNRGLETPEFYTAGRFRDRFHRPDVVALVLEELDVEKALARANAAAGVAASPPPEAVKAGLVASLPPVIEIIDPQSGANAAEDFLTVTYLIRASGSVAPEISARLDGQVVRTVRLGGALEGEAYDQISLPLGGRVAGAEFAVTLVAEDDHGASDPASVTLIWDGASAAQKKVALYVLAVGVSDYANEPPRDLDYAAKDADDLVRELLRQKELGLYRDVQVQALTDKDASLLRILGGLDWLRQQVGEGDVAIIFFAGHGIDEGFDYYFLPHSVEIRTGAQLGATGLGKSMLLAQLGAIYNKGAKVLAFIDTCYSGAQPEGARAGLPADVDKLAAELASAGNGIVVFTSSTGREVAYEDPRWQNGAFTEALLEALAGKAKPGDRHLSLSDLKRYLPGRVKELTDGKQTPQVYNETRLEIDAPIFVLH